MKGPHKAGYVNIIGNPNVGKSTLMNALVGERLSIITSKAQTTRHRILGIVNDKDFQIIFSDTPGILKPNYLLQENMMQFVDTAIGDADIILYVTDVVETTTKNPDYIEKINHIEVPVLIVLNKIDKSSQEEVMRLIDQWKHLVPKAEVFPVSALERFNLESLSDRITELLPESPPWFDKEQLTDKSLRFFASEIIREKIFLNYSKEIPYSVEVVVEEFLESEERYNIRAIVHVLRDSQKGILIGNKGSALKKVGTQARLDMEDFFQKKVYLELFVKVLPGWRENKARLRQFGY
ncbi:MAG: GTPase Era [Bacteroidales bacterium]|jgi:GTP-binding protein Era|nr:GTPase Era [Bacteroidales bacterium]MDD2824537.1 GTPase Era [Bacteroidales bacterium]MDD3100810.1 GTPase Era [Bacteroidales bacterium]MDD3639690.1 GTPase Era [Bacteroidales bacterium]MDD3944316.1 GTPase Era [Bacteroidales bacterium]